MQGPELGPELVAEREPRLARADPFRPERAGVTRHHRGGRARTAWPRLVEGAVAVVVDDVLTGLGRGRHLPLARAPRLARRQTGVRPALADACPLRPGRACVTGLVHPGDTHAPVVHAAVAVVVDGSVADLRHGGDLAHTRPVARALRVAHLRSADTRADVLGRGWPGVTGALRAREARAPLAPFVRLAVAVVVARRRARLRRGQHLVVAVAEPLAVGLAVPHPGLAEPDPGGALGAGVTLLGRTRHTASGHRGSAGAAAPAGSARASPALAGLPTSPGPAAPRGGGVPRIRRAPHHHEEHREGEDEPGAEGRGAHAAGRRARPARTRQTLIFAPSAENRPPGRKNGS